MMSKNCPFCSPEISEITFYESDHFRAIYNLSPILPGHSLIIPKSHCISLFDLNENELNECIHFTKFIIALLKKAYVLEGFDLSVQEKAEAGQSIEHFHIHVIPRKPGDLENAGDWYPEMNKANKQFIDSEFRPKLTRDKMKAEVEHIKSFLD